MQSDRAELISQIKALKDDNRQIRTIVDEKIKEIEPLQQALGKLRNANNATRGVCSSEDELNSLVCFILSFHMCEYLNLFCYDVIFLPSFMLSDFGLGDADP